MKKFSKKAQNKKINENNKGKVYQYSGSLSGEIRPGKPDSHWNISEKKKKRPRSREKYPDRLCMLQKELAKDRRNNLRKSEEGTLLLHRQLIRLEISRSIATFF